MIWPMCTCGRNQTIYQYSIENRSYSLRPFSTLFTRQALFGFFVNFLVQFHIIIWQESFAAHFARELFFFFCLVLRQVHGKLQVLLVAFATYLASEMVISWALASFGGSISIVCLTWNILDWCATWNDHQQTWLLWIFCHNMSDNPECHGPRRSAPLPDKMR